jgi:N6-adenosine-specific RNA methylase IME4
VSFFDPLEPESYDFAMIDYPWPFVARTLRGHKKSPAAQYKLMTLENIARTRPQDLLAPRGVALFWCTWPLIAKQAMIIENVFGLEIKSGGAWAKRTYNGKLRPGTGYIFRSVCEPFVIAAHKGHRLRGLGYNLVETLDHKVLDGVAREHSRKPDEMYHIIEKGTPGWRRADIFAREQRPGWTAWGNEKSKFGRAD